LQVLVHQDEAGWVAKATWHDETTLDGHLVEWEWLDVRETAALFDARGAPPAVLRTQNAYRVVGAYVTALLREPLGTFYRAALAAHVLAWLAACAACYRLALLATRSPLAATVAAGLTASGPGFIGYLGQVDPHPYAYASAAGWLLLLDHMWTWSWERPVVDLSPGQRRSQAALVGLGLCIASYSLEIGYPLLAIAWLYYGAWTLLAARRRAATSSTLARLGWLVVATGAFLVPYLAFRLLVERVLFAQVVSFNEPFAQVARTLEAAGQDGALLWVWHRTRPITDRWLAAFPPVVSLFALFGAATMSRRWLSWALTVGAVFSAAITLTKPAVRELFLVYPAVYLLAAQGVERAASWVSRWCAGHDARAQLVRWRALVAAVLVLLALGTTNADLAGNYDLPIRWYRVQ
jgi:hypothetical protein